MKELHLQCGRVALISDVDHDRCREHKWRSHVHNASGKPYVRTEIDKKTTYLHRFIVSGIVFLPPTMKVDHRSTDTLDNQRPNLRVASHDQNNLNRCGFGISGYKGVSMDRRLWRARLTFEGVEHRLGHFKDKKEAARAYDAKAHELFGEFAWLNFPDDWPRPDPDILTIEIPF